MKLNEFYDPAHDEVTKREKDQNRKSRLTLEQLGKLRRYREIKRAEEKEHDQLVQDMYAAPPAAGM